jgi:micrococcal nuclease
MLHERCSCITTKRASWIGALFVWALVFPSFAHAETNSECAADHIDEWAEVGYIFDGDTIRLTDQRIIRFIAINAPELAHDGRRAEPLAEEAKASLSRLLPVGSRVGLRFDREHLGPHRRVLAHIFDSQGRNVSATLLREGQAFAIAIPPNLWQSACYFRQEASARTSKLGIWAQPYYLAKQASQLRTRAGGFYRVTGRVEHIGRSQRSVWLDMSKYFAVRIPRKQLQYFSNRPLDALQDKVITVRGWARFYNNKLNMTLTHPAMLENTP